MDNDTDDDEPSGIYHPHAGPWFHAGFQPLPVVGKSIKLPEGFTGYQGRLLNYTDVVDFMINRPDDNIALRANGWAGIDVDDYTTPDGKVKTGGTTLALAAALWGPLPPTWRITARGPDDTISGIYLYRVPPGDPHLATQIILADENGERHADIEVIQWSHRYAVTWPSVHPDLGVTYQLWRPDGTLADDGELPRLTDLPWLPAPWIERLRREAKDPGLNRDPIEVPPQRATMADWHPQVIAHYADGLLACQGQPGSRHDTTGIILGRLARDEERRRAGATTAIDMLRDAFVAAVGRGGADGEYDRMVEFSRRQAASTASLVDVERRRWDELTALATDLGTQGPRVADPTPVKVDVEADDPFPADVFGVWRPADLAPYLDDDWRPEPPTLFTREDGKALWYRGNVNWLHGASGSGKTWVALMAAIQEMRAGRHVTWAHYEDPLPDKLVHRLKLLGATREEILELFHVMVVHASMIEGMRFLRAVNHHYCSGFLVIDSIGEAIGADGIDVKDDQRFTKWIHGTVRILAADGLTVLGIDHLPMGDPDRLDPVGSFRKKAATTGSMFLAQEGKPFTQDQAGFLTLTCAKDRSGVWAKGSVAATVHLRPGDDRPLSWSVVGPIDEGDEGPVEDAVVVAARHAYRIVSLHDPKPLSKNQTESGMVGLRLKANTKRRGIDYAILQGWLVESAGPRGATLLSKGATPPSERDLLGNV